MIEKEHIHTKKKYCIDQLEVFLCRKNINITKEDKMHSKMKRYSIKNTLQILKMTFFIFLVKQNVCIGK